MALSYALARTIGIAADRIIAALRSTPQITHRLEVKPQPSGVIYLDDAYNSNPEGFTNALHLMQILRKGNARRILVTPGMAELGEKHDASHRELGQKAAATVDIAVVVKPERIPTFLEGLKTGDTPPEIVTFEKFTDARDWLDKNAKEGDVVLVENDLPDLYERVFKA
jgi:UDP-N-acetylmuramoyl-tripeptide--D-alanyl-D-alanine ligase